jgi:hypothetical protein
MQFSFEEWSGKSDWQERECHEIETAGENGDWCCAVAGPQSLSHIYLCGDRKMRALGWLCVIVIGHYVLHQSNGKHIPVINYLMSCCAISISRDCIGNCNQKARFSTNRALLRERWV